MVSVPPATMPVILEYLMFKCAAASVMTAALAGCLVASTAHARTSTVAGLKTAGACNDEYKANKGALKDAKEKKKDFIAACRTLPPGTPTPIGTAATTTTPPAAPAPAPAAPAPTQKTAAPPPAPSTATPRTQANVAPGESGCGGGYAHLPTSHTAAQFCAEAGAKARCPGQAVVWVNTKSKIYHRPGANTYGHTKEGAYMCESDATAEGDRISKNGH